MSVPALRVFVNERPVDLPPGGTALEAVTAHDAALAERVAAGSGYLTDGRGIRLDGDTRLAPGAIVRVVLSARRGPDADA